MAGSRPLCATFAFSKKLNGMVTHRLEGRAGLERFLGKIFRVAADEFFDKAARETNEMMMVFEGISEFVIDVVMAQVHLTKQTSGDKGLKHAIDR